MATKTEHIHLELAHFNHFKNYWDTYRKHSEVIDTLVQAGVVQVSTVFEHATAQTGGFQVVSENGRDGSDGSDMKMCSVRTHRHGESYGAPVTNVHNKTGDLRVQVYERIQDRCYHFVIPYSAYSHISSTSNIDIPFELNGDPRRTNHWWKYEVQDFVEMSRLSGHAAAQVNKYRSFKQEYLTPAQRAQVPVLISTVLTEAGVHPGLYY